MRSLSPHCVINTRTYIAILLIDIFVVHTSRPDQIVGETGGYFIKLLFVDKNVNDQFCLVIDGKLSSMTQFRFIKANDKSQSRKCFWIVVIEPNNKILSSAYSSWMPKNDDYCLSCMPRVVYRACMHGTPSAIHGNHVTRASRLYTVYSRPSQLDLWKRQLRSPGLQASYAWWPRKSGTVDPLYFAVTTIMSKTMVSFS